jgi:hypothetical protein
MKDISNFIKRVEIEREDQWIEWIDKIPLIQFPEGWQIQIIPPFSGAMARFRVKKGEDCISVYLDVYDQLGFMGQPYWEVYPVEGDTERCYMGDTQGLIKIITKALKK